MRLISGIFLTCITLFSEIAVSQNEFIINDDFWGVEDGISHRDVQCIQQDNEGLIWLGTKNGLNRFDGYGFTWLTEEKDKLQSSEINFMLKDQQGRLWLIFTGETSTQSVRSIDILDPMTQEVQSFEASFPESAGLKATDIKSFCTSSEQKVALLTRNHRIITYSDSLSFIQTNIDKQISLGRIKAFKNGNFWIERLIGKELVGFYVLDKDGKVLQYYDEIRQGFIDKAEGFETFFYDKERLEKPVWVYDIDVAGDTLIDPEATAFFRNINPAILEATVYIKRQGIHYWLKTDHGEFYVFNQDGSLFYCLHKNIPDTQFQNDFFLDKEGVMWVSTQYGLHRFATEKPLFKRLLHQNKNKRGDAYAIRQILPVADSEVWVAVENQVGLCRLDVASGKDSIIIPSTEFSKIVQFSSEGNIIYKRKDSLFYINPLNAAIERKVPITNKFGHFFNTWSCFEDENGALWMCDDEQSDLYRLEHDTLTRLTNWDPEQEKIRIYQFLSGPVNSIWLATNRGLFYYPDNLQQDAIRYWSQGKDEYNLPYDDIYHIRLNNDSSFWLATNGSGLVHWHPERGVLDRITHADGLPNNTIYAVYKDQHDNLWLPTDNGIARFNIHSKLIKGYTEKDGLCHREFNRLAHARDAAGNLYFGGLKGITRFNPDNFNDEAESSLPPVVITQFQQFDGKQGELVNRTKEIRETHSITLLPADRFFRLEFALLAYDDVDEIRYAYRLEDEKDAWNYQRENILRFSRLPYGSHDLLIKGQMPNGQWSDKQLRIKVIVEKPFYLKTWFIAGALLGLILMVIVFIRLRTARLQKRTLLLEEMVERRTATIQQQAEELKSLEQLKSRFFANVSHELRTPLTLLLGPIESVLKRNAKDEKDRLLLEFARRNGHKLQKLIDEILDLSKLENNKLEVAQKPVHFYPYLIEHLAQYQSFADSDRLTFRTLYKADESLWLMLDTSKFEKIIDNFLSNALKFTPQGGVVTLAVEKRGGDIMCSVHDTGRGIHPDDLPFIFDRFYQAKQGDIKTEGGTGIGLSLSKELAELMGGKVWAESEPGKGSTFFYQFPMTALSPELKPSLAEIVNEREHGASVTDEELVHRLSSETNILLVEDNDDLREYLAFLLSEATVSTAENGQVAWDAITTMNSLPDIIISDFMMPVMDGMQLLKKIKADDRFRHIPTIMLTAKVNTDSKVHALRIGVDDYLTKPFREEELKARINNLIQNHKERLSMFLEQKNGQNGIAIERSMMAEVDNHWLEQVEEIVGAQFTNPKLSVTDLAEQVSLSERQFRRRLKQLSGMTPSQYIQEMRLQKAYLFLSDGIYSSSKEVCFAAGFNDTRYFARLFQKRFGIKPSELKS